MTSAQNLHCFFSRSTQQLAIWGQTGIDANGMRRNNNNFVPPFVATSVAK